MHLRAWLDEPVEGRNIRRLALNAGVSRNVIYRVLDGHRPRESTARCISAATGGDVSVEEILSADAATEAA